MRKVYKEKK